MKRLLWLALLAACGGGPPPAQQGAPRLGAALLTTVSTAPVATVTLAPNLVALKTNDTLQLGVTLRDSAGNGLAGRVIVWAASNGNVTVNQTGQVVAKSTNHANVTATSEGKVGLSSIYIIWSTTVTPNAVTDTVGRTVQLTATLRDRSGGLINSTPPIGAPITWTTSNAAVATVGPTGLVRGLTSGLATIRATSGGISGASTVTVVGTAPPPPPPAVVASVRVSPTAVTLAVRQGATFVASAFDSAGQPVAGRVATWTTSDPIVVTVSAAGLATAVGVGTGVVTATVSPAQGTAVVTVVAPPAPGIAGVIVWPGAVSGIYPSSIQVVRFSAAVFDSAGITVNKPVTWSSSDASIATVDTAGLISTTGVGTAAITATTSNGFSASGLLTVSGRPPPRFNGIYANITLRNGRLKIERRDSAGVPPILVTAGDTGAAGFRSRASTAPLHAASMRQLATDLATRADTVRFGTVNAVSVDSVFCAALGCWVTVIMANHLPWTSSPPIGAAALMGLAHALEAAARGDTLFAPGDSLPYVRVLP